MTKAPLPIGIRNNNPGNLRQNYSVSYPTVLNEGFAQFRSITDGAQAMVALLWHYYNDLHLTTLDEIISRYAPASENDVVRYTTMVALFIRANPLSTKTQDMQLVHAWNMINLARAMVRVECGVPPLLWDAYPEWVSCADWSLALHRAGKWLTV